MTSAFLQRLRREQSLPGRGAGPQLHYLLSPGGCHLSLLLAAPAPNGLLENPRPYRLQPAHWQRPPQFLDAADIGLLRRLAEHQSVEQGQGEYALPAGCEQAWLRALADTGRLRLATGDKCLHWGQPLAVEYGWDIDEAGGQQLGWRPAAGLQLLPTEPPSYLVPERNQLGPVADPPCTEAGEWLRRRPRLAPGELGEFLQKHGAALKAAGLSLPRALPLRRVSAPPRPRLLLSSDGGADCLRLQFQYRCDEVEFTLDADVEIASARRYQPHVGAVLELERDSGGEAAHREALLRALAPWAPRPLPEGGWDFADWRAPMATVVPALERQGWQIRVAPGFRQHFVLSQGVHLDASLHESDWFDLALQVEVEGELLPLLPLLRDCARRYSQAQLESLDGGDLLPLTLAGGRQLLLPAARLARWLALLVELRLDESPGDRLRLPRAQLDRLHYLAEAGLEASVDSGPLLDEARQRLSPPPLEGVLLPPEFRAELRPYQRLGVAWLQQRRALELGGILADDMGLGKTVQLLAHLAIEAAAGRLRQPALVVAPSSLLHNWQGEAQRFAPQLDCVQLHGPGRHRYWGGLQGPQLLLTSYALLARDLHHWREQPLGALILDEAQTIKNAHSQVAGCARELNAPYKLCLTGTPVENHLGELWSLFEFMMPGFLPGRAQFNRCYRKPIEEEGDGTRARDLLERISPFVLRRTKETVAGDLPPKTEMLVRLPLTDAQRDLYEALREEGLRQIHERREEGERRLLVLNLLTRLRLACCDPGLADPAQCGTASAKRRHLLEMLTALVEEGRSALVFSQFVGMLELIAGDLEGAGIPYLILTGASRARGQLVERFQAGEAPVFLISLKAGGTGLNLTRADTVIHCDPWWNAAAEAQASDRAHRIGQRKPVFVYKLLAEGTLEEKMLALQQRKRELAAQVYRTAEANGRQLALDSEDLLSLLEDSEA